MPESTDQPGPGDADLDVIADELYALPPDEFVPARDDRVAAAKEAGDRDLARALARLRRPTKAAWLANLLARHRAEQLDGLVALAHSLAQAQQELDGDALRALSGQRHRAVAAMARDAGRLAARRGESVNDALVREVAGILDAALADPAVAEEVRAGRLTKTVRYSGFGPANNADGADGDGMAAWAATAASVAKRPARRPAPEPEPEPDDDEQEARAERERAERERLAAERKAREQELAAAEADEAAARAQQESDEAERDRADDRHAAARARVAELAEALDAARHEEQAALEALRTAAGAARDSARDAAAAAVRTTRARTRLEQLPAAP